MDRQQWFETWVRGFCAGMLTCLVMCGVAVMVVDARRRAADAENEAAWFRTCQAAWDRGCESGRRLERTYIHAGGLD